MYGGDPFENIFGGFHQQMRRQMRDMDRMMNSVMDPFNMFGSPFGMIEDGSARRAQPGNNMALMNDFGFGGGMFGGLMRQMDDIQHAAMNDPNAHVFSQSTMISYDGSTGSQPRIVERSVRKAGDVKETRNSVRNGEGGVGDRMSIEHTIGNRTHVIEKKRDSEGRIREQQHFVNLDQHDAEDFDREFSSRVRHNMGGTGGEQRRAIEGRRSNSSRSSLPVEQRDRQAGSTSGTNVPIVTLPDDDGDENTTNRYQKHVPSARPSSAHRSHPRYDGPTIRELDEEEEEQHRDTKRRKGVFGRLFKANDE